MRLLWVLKTAEITLDYAALNLIIVAATSATTSQCEIPLHNPRVFKLIILQHGCMRRHVTLEGFDLVMITTSAGSSPAKRELVEDKIKLSLTTLNLIL